MVGKMMRVGGRIFVPEGDGDTLVGSMKSFMHGDGRLDPEEVDLLVRNGRPVEGTALEQEDGEDDFSETSSMAVVDGHPTPRISPSISTLNDTDVPHQSLDELPSAALDEHLAPLQYEHPAEPQIETKDWAATNEVETTEAIKIEDTKAFKTIMEIEETQETDMTAENTEAKDIIGTKVFKKIMEIEKPEKIEAIEEIEETDELEEIREVDDIDKGKDTVVETEYQRFLLAEHRREKVLFTESFGASTAAKIDEEGSVPPTATQPWSPSTPWRKEHATAPVRPVLTARASSQFSGTTTRMRKTSDSIKSLVEKFENLTPQNTPGKGA